MEINHSPRKLWEIEGNNNVKGSEAKNQKDFQAPEAERSSKIKVWLAYNRSVMYNVKSTQDKSYVVLVVDMYIRDDLCLDDP